ncbi:MAG: TauD/TfdA family dioxygenase [Acidimicrobiales bacterium]
MRTCRCQRSPRDHRAWNQELATELGFVLVRGLPIDELDEHEAALAFVALGTHLGTPVGQNKAGDLLTHIRDERLPDPSRARRYRTNLRQEFHTDGADIIGLLCLHQGRSGGESRIASTGAIVAQLREQRPDLYEVLLRPLPWDRQGEQLPGEPAWFELAPFAEVGGEVRVFYIGWYVRASQQHPDAPRLTAEQLEAMALLESLADDPANHLEMAFEPGDVQLLNNARILHAREAYEDDPDPAERRHLLRLWLAAHAFASVEELLRGGLGTPLADR